MWPDRVSNPGPLTYESGVLPIALRGPAPKTINPPFGTNGKSIELSVPILRHFRVPLKSMKILQDIR